MRVKVGRAWGPEVPVQRGWAEVAWQPRGPLMEVTGERHSHRSPSDREEHNIERHVEMPNPGLTGVVE